MEELIEALQIAAKYANDYQSKYPTGAEHDALFLSIDAEDVSAEDLARLEELSFFVSEEFAGALTSFRFGNC